MTMTKATLATTLFEQLGLNKREASDMVDRFFEEIAAALAAGDCVKLSGFGNFMFARSRHVPDAIRRRVKKSRSRRDA